MWSSQVEAGSISKRCLPDYEEQLKNVRRQQHANNNLINALLDYADINGTPGDRNAETILALMGYLTFQQRRLNKTESSIMEELESTQK